MLLAVALPQLQTKEATGERIFAIFSGHPSKDNSKLRTLILLRGYARVANIGNFEHALQRAAGRKSTRLMAGDVVSLDEILGEIKHTRCEGMLE